MDARRHDLRLSKSGGRPDTSFGLEVADFKAYQEQIGPGRSRPARPSSCPLCDWTRAWFDGWRWVFSTILDDGRPVRFDEGLALQRVVCSRCHRSWPLRPAFLYPHRSLEPDLVEAAALVYLSEERATYKGVAACFRLLAPLGLALGWLACGPASGASDLS